MVLYRQDNSGTTNALRVLGKKAGLIVFLGDLLKAIVACTIVRLIADHFGSDITLIYILYTGIGVVLGHNFPFYMNFKGGKGIAATSGVIIAIGDWRIIVVCLALFIAAVAITRYVSLGSLLVVTAFIVMWLIFGQLGMLPLTGRALYESYILVAIFVLMAYIRHKANIVRLIKGTENKLGQKKE